MINNASFTRISMSSQRDILTYSRQTTWVKLITASSEYHYSPNHTRRPTIVPGLPLRHPSVLAPTERMTGVYQVLAANLAPSQRVGPRLSGNT